MYRASALRDVLPIYASKVDNSFDFLTKDMGKSASNQGLNSTLFLVER